MIHDFRNRMDKVIHETKLSNKKKNKYMQDIDDFVNEFNNISVMDDTEFEENVRPDTEKEDRILYLQKYYSEKPDDCPEEEWPFFNSSEINTGKYGRTELHQACALGNINEIKRLILDGASVIIKDSAGLTPLELAILENDTDMSNKITKLFIELGKH